MIESEAIEREYYDLKLKGFDLDYDKQTPFKHTKVFNANLKAVRDGWFLINNQGGTSSSKTYSILEVIIILLNDQPNWVCTVCGETLPSLKTGAIRDFNTILQEEPFLKNMIKGDYNKGDQYAKFKNGSIIEFKSYDEVGKAKSGKRNILFVTEANHVKKDIVKHLFWRTKNQVFFDYNADSPSYIHSNYLIRSDCKNIISDYRHNRYCPEQTKKELEELKERNYSDWLVYARGQTGNPTNEDPFFKDFNKSRHLIDKVVLNKDLPCLISMDFNFNPVSAIRMQLIWGRGLFIDSEYQENGGTQKMLENKLIHIKNEYVYDFTGDNSGHSNKSSSPVSDWQQVEQVMGVRVADVTYEANKRHRLSRKLCNQVFWKIPVYISKTGCPKLIEDLRIAKPTPDGKLFKDNDKYRMDLCDAFRYGIHFFFRSMEEINAFAVACEEWEEAAHEQIEQLIEESEGTQFPTSSFRRKSNHK